MNESSKLKPQNRPWIFWFLSDTWELFKRNIAQIRQVPDQLMNASLQPIVFLALFLYVFGGAINVGHVKYVEYLIPGILVMTACLSGLTTMVGIASDMSTGIVDRFRSLPMIKSTILGGTVMADLVRSLLAIVVLIIAAFIFGFRSHASIGAWALTVLILLLITYAFSWLTAPFGMLAKSVESAQQFGFLFFPLTMVSSAFVPASSMPGWLRGFATYQPISQVVDTVRALLLDLPLGNHLWISLAWCAGLIAISIPVASWMFKHRTSS